jgi:hypothetical protein
MAPYEMLVAIPIRHKCFGIRLFTGLTGWSSLRFHHPPPAEPLAEDDPASILNPFA